MRYLVLTGGGSRGAWQAGRMLKLWESGVRWDAVVGTSVGAVNAVGLSYLGPQGTVDLWRELKGRSSVMALNFAWPWNYTGVYNFNPLRKMLESKVKGLTSSIPAFACVVDSRRGNILHLPLAGPESTVASRVVASCVVCGIQTPEAGLVDGGHREIAPVTWARDQGAIQVDVIATSPSSEELDFSEPKKGSWFPAIWYAMRAIDMMTHEIWLRDLDAMPKKQVKVHAPDSSLGIDTLDYSPNAILKLINLGYGKQQIADNMQLLEPK